MISITPLIWWHSGDFPFRNLLVDPLMWSCPIEIINLETQDTMQMLLMEDQHMIQALSSNTSQKAFTDGIGARGVIRRFEQLDATRCCNSSETGAKLAIIIANEVLRRLSIWSGLPKLLCSPSVGGGLRHTDVDHFP